MVRQNVEYYEFLQEAYDLHHKGDKTWKDLAKEFFNKFGVRVSDNALRHRVERMRDRYESLSAEEITEINNQGICISNENKEFTEYGSDGSIDAFKIISNIKDYNGDKDEIMRALGYKPEEWELMKLRVSLWDGGNNGESRYAVKYKIKPVSQLSGVDYINSITNAIKESIGPSKYEIKPFNKSLSTNRLMEIPPVELHLGKMGSVTSTGEEYNMEVAKNRFYEIFNKIYAKQDIEQCETCLLVIGSDFFNSESDNATSTHKVPQQNCAHYIDIFSEGVKMYHDVIQRLRDKFNLVNVMLCSGNHARAMEFFLYVALEQSFKNDSVVKFVGDYKETQVYNFGDCSIFFNHGDSELKRLIKSIPAEFFVEWGSHKFRELHLGHLHKEVVVDDDSGMITRRVGSPCSSDMWHRINRFVGTSKKHQIFIWDKRTGLDNIYYIPF